MGSYSEDSFVKVETPEGEELNSYPFILIVGSENLWLFKTNIK